MDVKLNGSKIDLPIDDKMFLEMIPSAAAMWNGPQSICALNQGSQRLIGFSEADLLDDNRLWSKRVFCADRIIFSQREKKMERGDSEITCDYRFYPKGLNEPIWIRELIAPLGAPHLYGKWISIYSDISDLKEPPAKEQQKFIEEEMHEVIGCLFHEIKNRLHLLSMELELAVLESGDSPNAKKITGALHAVNHSLKALHDYLIHGQSDLSPQNC